ncbi:hypothetical protein B0T11DRAFT_117674 [Plectosphaerella cucumerina]|uniref:DUF7053 domain-containing protein n=1 Tax=Plectosphaerella cucumerina TaxID=40658 RepID=A0A8K0T9J2_9PEZI|nr:hypothetical protein B0T11DRAFT_117674 [Plectosphaerella cucumerina]
MSKRSTFTSITPLPPTISRATALTFLQDHLEMIDLNPLVKERHRIPVPAHASPDEQHCVWYSLTDEISYLPGASSAVSYTCAFHNLPGVGLQTHCYAPMGLDIRDRWSVGGTGPGEKPEPRELGLDLPAKGLYLREDVDIRCNLLMTAFVKKTLKKSHGALVDKLAAKAAALHASGTSLSSTSSNSPPASLTPSGTPSGSSTPSHTPRARSVDRPQAANRPPVIAGITTSGFVPYHVPPPLRSPPDQQPAGGGYLFPRDASGQVPWQSLTTKQQQQRVKEDQQRDEREAAAEARRAAAHNRSHSQPPLSPISQTASPHELLQYELAAPEPVHHAPVELDAPNYPAVDSYGDISSRTPFDDKTPDTPNDRRPFENDAAAAEAWARRQPDGLLPGSAPGLSPISGVSAPGPDQQRHPSVLRPGYTIARKPVAPSGLH